MRYKVSLMVENDDDGSWPDILEDWVVELDDMARDKDVSDLVNALWDAVDSVRKEE